MNEKKFKASPKEIEISQKIKELMAEKGIKPYSLARKVKIEPANFYRMLKNERGWRIKHVEKICDELGTTIPGLLGRPLDIPILFKISALEPFPNPDLIEKEIGYVQYRGKGEMNQLASLYALEIVDRSMMPVFQPGTKIILEKDSFKEIKEENMVVCPDDQGKAYICRVHFTDNKQITLRSLNPTIPDRILPRTHLKLCDRVIAIYPSD